MDNLSWMQRKDSSARKIRRGTVDLTNFHETLLEEEISVLLREVDEYEKRMKQLEKALKAFQDSITSMEQSTNELIKWFISFMSFHCSNEAHTWLTTSFLRSESIMPISFQEPSGEKTQASRLRNSSYNPAANSPATRALQYQQKRSTSSDRFNTISVSEKASECKKTVQPFSIHEEIPGWTELLESIVKFRKDLGNNTEYLLLDTVVNSGKEFTKEVDLAKKSFEKARSDLITATQKLNRERARLLTSEFLLDIGRLFQLEKEMTSTQVVYDESVVHLMDILKAEQRNVDLGRATLQYLETLKRYFGRVYDRMEQYQQNSSGIGKWKDNLEVALVSLHEKKKQERREMEKEQFMNAWTQFGQVLCSEDCYVLDIILEILKPPLSTIDEKVLVIKSIIYLFVARLEPFPSQLADYVHLASAEMTNENYYRSEHAEVLVAYLTKQWHIITENLRKYSVKELLELTLAFTLLLSNIEMICIE